MANAQTTTAPLEKLPYSGAVLMTRAIHDGRVQLPSGSALAPLLLPPDTCSPAPCVLPNVNIFKSSNPVNETPVVVNPKNTKQLMSGANDYNCSPIAAAFYNSNNAGSTWSHICAQNLSGDQGF